VTMAKEVTKIVNRVLDRKIEDKQIHWRLDLLTPHNSPIAGAGDVIPIVQQIPVGPGIESRLGDRITPKYLRVSGVVSLNPGSSISSYEPLLVRVLAFRQNDVTVGSATASVDTGNLIRDTAGGTGSRQFSGNTQDLLMPLNGDKFKSIFDKQYMLCPQDTNAGTAGNLQMPHQFRKYSFKVKLPKQFKYDPANGNWANNFAPFMSIGYAYPDGRPADLVGTAVVNTAVAHFVYEDA